MMERGGGKEESDEGPWGLEKGFAFGFLFPERK